jgi:GH25 family lysozyme M1 (1,4-beta-N-acetylmuramidase)
MRDFHPAAVQRGISIGRGTVPVLLLLIAACAGSTASVASAARDLGVDVSHFQGETGVPQANWNQLAAEGRTFAFTKATEGLNPPGNIDETWDENVAGASAAGILSGVYHFARPDNRRTTTGAVQEATFFANTAGSAMDAGHLRPVLDLERGLNAVPPMTSTELTDWVIAFIDQVVALKGPAAEPIIYTTSTYTAQLDARVADYDLWIRSNFGDPQTGTPTGLGPFNDWLLWQYNVGPAGGFAVIDQNVLHNESATLQSLVIPEPSSVAALMVVSAATALLRRRRLAA